MGALFMGGVFHGGKVLGNEVLEVMPPFIPEQIKWKETLLLILKGNFVELCSRHYCLSSMFLIFFSSIVRVWDDQTYVSVILRIIFFGHFTQTFKPKIFRDFLVVTCRYPMDKSNLICIKNAKDIFL